MFHEQMGLCIDYVSVVHLLHLPTTYSFLGWNKRKASEWRKTLCQHACYFTTSIQHALHHNNTL